MKIVYILQIGLLLLNLFSKNVSGQVRISSNHDDMGIFHIIDSPTKPQEEIFDKKPTIQSIYLSYKDNIQNYVIINFLKGSDNENYDLDFKGDKNMLLQKHPEIFELISNKDYLMKIYRSSQFDTNEHLKALIFYRDKTSIEFFNKEIDSVTRLEMSENIWAYPPKLKTGYAYLENIIQEELKKNKDLAIIDSALIFKLKIGKDGTFKNSSLLFGRDSSFSRLVNKILNKKETSFFADGTPRWSPAIRLNTGRPFETNVKIYIKLRPDQSVLITVPKVQRNWSGD